LAANIRVWWKGLIVENTLAYYDAKLITAVERFKAQAPGASCGLKAPLHPHKTKKSFSKKIKIGALYCKTFLALLIS
jgi:hypothetical protein